MPIHRLVRNVAPSTLAGLRNQLEKFFTLETIPLIEDFFGSRRLDPTCYCERSEAISKMIEGAEIGVLGLERQSLVLLKQRQDISISGMMPGNRSQIYGELSISLINHVILDKMLGIKAGEEDIAYTVDVGEACQQVNEGKYQLAFLSNPPQPETIRAIANAKDRMPHKSTYFYPKLPAGLVINSLE